MHEFSIVQSLLGLVEKVCKEHRAKSVSKIVVSVGVLSGVDPHLLKIAFDTFKENTIAHSAELILQIEKLTLRCSECGSVSEKEELNVLCPKCGSFNTTIESGQDLLLKSVEMEYEDED
ncbi:hydrogenase maturation nickel metallochaperone HypA [Thermocrinis sp.]